MASPIEFLMEHRKTILKQYRQNDSKPKKTWENLQEILPPLSESMSFNTFKQYMSVFVSVTNGLDKVRQQRDEVIQTRDALIKDLKITSKQKTLLEKQVDNLKIGLDKVRQNRDEVTQSRDNLIEDLNLTTKQKAQLERQVDDLKTRLDKVRQKGVIDVSALNGLDKKLDKKPNRIAGWNVRKSEDGYYRCYRKIAKRVHSIYIGKNLDFKKARDRITEKEKKLGLL
jgi:chromosome segregation ATPase